jgi:hypothetical protein
VWDGAFSAEVSYDVDYEGGKTRHFDVEGSERVFEHEKEGAWGASKVTPR